MPIVLEAVCAAAKDVMEAEAGGADRIELCSAMPSGGLTPSLGTFLEARARTRLPIVCMCRPRAGAFEYDETELATLVRDAELFAAHGAAGVVAGVLTAQCAVDEASMRRIVGAVAPCPVVFHRAFDLAADPLRALDVLVAAGVRRVLTSGRERSAMEGVELINALVERAGGAIEILPGGGIRAGNVRELVRKTGVQAVHCGPFVPRVDASARANPRLSFADPGLAPEQYMVTDRAALAATRAALDEP
jgi:copper homeostasis protein